MNNVISIGDSQKNILRIIIQFVFIFEALFFLRKTDASYSVYILCAGIAAACVLKNRVCNLVTAEKLWIGFQSILFSLAVVFANMSIEVVNTDDWKDFEQFAPLIYAYAMIMIFIGVFLGSWNIIKYIYALIDNDKICLKEHTHYNSRDVFIFSFTSIVIVALLYLFLMCFPGIVISDVLGQIGEITRNSYQNHNPVIHTLVIGFWYKIGTAIFGTNNAGIATYIVFQIVIMSLIYAYTIMTVCQLIKNKYLVIMIGLFYALMPYNISFTCNATKDTIFAGFVLLFTVSLVRLLFEIGRVCINYLTLILGGFGFCFFRVNGYLAFLVTSLLFGGVLLYALLFRKKSYQGPKAVLVISCVIISIVSGIVIEPLFNYFGVKKTEASEPFSIPEVQIAKTLVAGGELYDDERELLENLLDIESWKKYYVPDGSDPLKGYIGDSDYLREHGKEYFILWVKLGFRYPREYFTAWVDMTRRYWNAGYDRWIVMREVHPYPNDYNIYPNHPCKDYLYMIASAFRIMPVLSIFTAIGLHIWILLGITFYGIFKKKKYVFACFPEIFIWLSLLFAAPAAEFRYIYSLFLVLPVLVISAVYEVISKEKVVRDHER